MVFQGKVGKGYYYNKMDGDMFMKWVVNENWCRRFKESIQEKRWDLDNPNTHNTLRS